MNHTLFTRRYADGLSVTAVWAPNPEHAGYRYVGELELIAERGSSLIGSELHCLTEENLALREERTTALTNSFVVRARQREGAHHH